jgi:hypothetical protein
MTPGSGILDPMSGRLLTSDAERERVAWMLRESYARGGLSLEAFVERLDRVFAARAAADLHELLPATKQRPLPAAMPPSGVDLELLGRHLAADEAVYWLGHPDPGLRFTRDDVLFIPLSVLMAAVFVGWVAVVFANDAPALFRIVGVAIAVLGVYLVAGRFFLAARRRRRTLYVVTSRRVMQIVHHRRRDAFKSLYLTVIPSITVRARGGAVLFGDAAPYESDLPRFLREEPEQAFGFYRVGSPRAIADLVEHLRERAADAPAQDVARSQRGPRS